MKRLIVDNHKEDTYLLPDELWWSIFLLIGEEWHIYYPHLVCRSWSILASNEIKTIGHLFRRPKFTDALIARAHHSTYCFIRSKEVLLGWWISLNAGCHM